MPSPIPAEPELSLTKGPFRFASAVRGVGRVWSVLTLVLLLMAVATYVHHVFTTFTASTVDDSAITYAYADNIARGHGFRLTPGASPVEGYSNPLEVMLLVPFARAGVDLDMAAKGVNLAFVALGLLGWGLFLWKRLRGLAKAFAILPCLITLQWPTFNYWTTAGLEGGTLAGMQMLILLALAWLPANRRGDLMLGLLAGLLAMARPEGVAYAALTLAAGLLVRPRRWRACAVFAGICVLLILIRFALFRDVVPNTYWAKVSGVDVWPAGRAYVSSFFTKYGKAYFFILLPILIPFAWRARIPALAALAQFAFALFFACQVGGDWMRHWRFMQFLQGPATALVALGVYATLAPGGVLLRRIPDLGRVALAALLLWPTLLEQKPFDGWRARATAISKQRDVDMRKIATCAGTYRELGARLGLGRRLLEADIDVGGMSYPQGLDVLDLGGLADRQVGKQWARQPSVIPDYIFGERRPDTIHIHGAWVDVRRIHQFSSFALDYREMGPQFLRNMLLGPLTAIRADLVDPPVAPFKLVGISVGTMAINGVSSFADDDKIVLFLHATSNGAPPADLHWLDPDGKRANVLWHGGYDVSVGPSGSGLLGLALVNQMKLPLRLEGTSLVLDELPVFPIDTETLPSLSRLPLLRMGGFYVPSCHPEKVLDRAAPPAARARGLSLLTGFCGAGLSAEERARAAREFSADLAELSDPDDRYDTLALLSALGVGPSIGQRMDIERARARHFALDEVALAWAGRELADAQPSPHAIKNGLGMLAAAREYARVLTTVLARGWQGRPEAQPALCLAVRALGFKASALDGMNGMSCAGSGNDIPRITLQNFEDPGDKQLHFTGAAERWIREDAATNVVGGRGQRRLSTTSGKNASSAAGELVWGPMPWAGTRFGALLGGGALGAFVAVEGYNGRAWTELAHLLPPSPGVVRPVLALLPAQGFSQVRVRVVDPSGPGGLVVDSVEFIGP